MLQVKRAGHSTLTTPDLDRMVDYFTRLVGLSVVAREKGRAILATKAGLEAIVLERGGAVEAPRLSFQIAPGCDPGEIVSRLKKAGIKSERRSDITPGIGEAVAFKDPKGTTLEIFSGCSFAPEDETFTGVMPLKFGHIAYQCPDVQGIVKFYCDMLGFRVSDWRSDFFAFLRCSRDHHTVNFLRDAKTAIHHIAFEVRDWSDIKRAGDILAKGDIKLTWGPLRHIIGHNIAIYHKNPDGVVVEFFCEMDQMYDEELGFFEPRPWHQDRPQRPKVWGDDTLSNWWGPMSHSPKRTNAAVATKQTNESARRRAAAERAPALARAQIRPVEKKSGRPRKTQG
jgi:catechol 2,3-dioxygenase-like lactoylglutathione lyase family enzyme